MVYPSRSQSKRRSAAHSSLDFAAVFGLHSIATSNPAGKLIAGALSLDFAATGTARMTKKQKRSPANPSKDAASGRLKRRTIHRRPLAPAPKQIRALEHRSAVLDSQLSTDEHPVPYIALLANGIIRRANRGAVELLGSPENVIDKPLRLFVPPDNIERLYRHIHQCLTAGAARPHIETEITLKTASGLKPVRLVSKPVLKAPRGQERVIPTALVDVTEARGFSHWAPLKQAGAELRCSNELLAAQAEEHRRHLEQTVHSMETFCYGIAHELRAPVRAMQGFSEILLREPENQNRDDYLRRIAAAAARLDTLISDLLAYGRLHHSDVLVVPTAVAAMIDRVIDALSAEIAKTRAVVQVVPTDARVLAHPMLLVQALQNLVANALKFVPPGTAPRVKIETRTMGKFIRVSVRDNGVGIQVEYGDKIFGLFQRAHADHEYPGTGIGLAMVKRIVELLNGRVGVDCAVQQGSCFWIELPSAPAEVPLRK